MIDVLTSYAQTVLVLLGALTAITIALGTIWRKGITPVHRKVEKILAIAEYEFTPNGGGSTADKLIALEENQTEMKHHLADMKANGSDVAVDLAKRSVVVDERLEKIEKSVDFIGTEFVRREKIILVRLDKIDTAGHVAADANVVITTDAKAEVIERIDDLEAGMKDGPHA